MRRFLIKLNKKVTLKNPEKLKQFTLLAATGLLTVLFNNCGQGFNTVHLDPANLSSSGNVSGVNPSPTLTPISSPQPTATPSPVPSPLPPTPSPTPIPTPPPGTAVCPTQQLTRPKKLYHIGHSLVDRMADLLNDIVELEMGLSYHPYSYKSIPGSTLLNHWNNPTSGRKGNIQSISSPYEILSTQNFDALVITEAADIESFMNDPVRNTRIFGNNWANVYLDDNPTTNQEIYIYSTWWSVQEDKGPQTAQGYTTFINQTEGNQHYWEEFAQYIHDQNSGNTVRIIPGGLVLTEILRRWQAGSLQLPGGRSFRDTFFKANSDDCSSPVHDHIHLSGTGIYTIALAQYMVIYGSCAASGFTGGIPFSGNYSGTCSPDPIDPNFAVQIRNIVFEVINNYQWRPN